MALSAIQYESLAVNTEYPVKDRGHITISFATFTAGALVVQVKCGGLWANDTGTAINSAGRVTVSPCDRFKLVQSGGVAPSFTAGAYASAT